VRTGRDVAQGAPVVIAHTARLGPAYARLTEVLQQWGASEGAIVPGTRVSIVDTFDGGEVVFAEYQGFEVNTFTGR